MLGLRKENDAAAGTNRVHCNFDQRVAAYCEQRDVCSAALCRCLRSRCNIASCVERMVKAKLCCDGVAFRVEGRW